MANALQAVLDKAARGEGRGEANAPATPAPVKPRRPRRAAPAAAPAPAAAAPEKKSAAAPAPVAAPAPASAEAEPTRRPVREGKRFVGAHVEPEVARQLKMIAAEDDTTIQDLLEEALDLLFAKKGKATLAALRRRG